ncbi:MAG: glycerate kinase [Acidimicrobiia bacterium]|nr:glycerate kinase [Acidimicrobiia bacterium]
MHVLAAPDKFRGTATAAEVAAAIAEVVEARGGTCDRAPMADGGEGTLDALGGPNRSSVVTGPLGDPVEAGWRLEGRTAVIEMARASGLALVGGPEGNDAVAASTYGTGELLVEAVELGARRVVVAVGGSATTDGGFGALRAMYPPQRFRGVELVVACDVRLGFVDAAEVFAPQKGASDAEVALLRRRLERLVLDYQETYGVDVTDVVGGGAAGGLAGGLAAIGAELVSGFELVAEEIELYERMSPADLVITGEGFVDEESFDGKVIGGISSYAADLEVDLFVVAGQVFDGVSRRVDAVSLTERFGGERAMGATLECVGEAVAERLAQITDAR